MEFKKRLLKGALVSKGYNMEDVAKWLDVNVSTIYRKMERNGDFSRREINIISSKLKLKDFERDAIFLIYNLRKCKKRWFINPMNCFWYVGFLMLIHMILWKTKRHKRR